jgi:hypothetical protein
MASSSTEFKGGNGWRNERNNENTHLKGNHGAGGNGYNRQQDNLYTAFNTVISYFSITYLFTFVVAIIDKFIRNLRKKTVIA